MIEHIRLSEKAKQQLIVIKRKTGIENWNVLCRWALCLSLAEESIPPFEDIQTDSSVEMTWRVFSGDYHEIFMSLIEIKFNEQLLINDINNFFKLHLHRGVSFLNSKVDDVKSMYDMVM